MDFIYDIVINLNDEFYEFYEWNKEDDILHVRRIPHITITEKSLNNIRKNNVRFNKKLLNEIKNKTEIFTDFGINKLEYVVLLNDSKSCIVLELDKSGEIIKSSSLLLDEEQDIVDASDNEITNINYEIINKKGINFNTRYENKIVNYINKELDYLYKSENINKLKFLYNEWFDLIEEDIKLIYKKLKSILINEINPKHIDFYNLIKLSNKERI